MEWLEPRLLLANDFWVSGVIPGGAAGSPFDQLQIDFSRAVDDTTFTLDDVTISDSGGLPILPGGLTRLSATRYQLDLTGSTGLDTYTLTFGPDILADGDGQAMNQDGDATPGEPEDAYRVALFSADATIADGDFAYDGQALFVYGATVEIFGDHIFSTVDLQGTGIGFWIGGAPQLDTLRVDGGSTFLLGGRSTTNVSTIALTGNSILLCLGANTRDRFGGEWFGAGVTI